MKKKIIVGVLLVLAITGLVAANVIKSKGAIPAFGGGKVVPVKVKKIEKGNISSTVSASGVIEEVEKAEVYFDTSLKVEELLAEKNQKVEKGQKLLELDLDALNSELEQLKINKAVQELAIQKIKSYGSGSTAASEAAVIVAENNIKSAENTYNNEKRNYENSKILFQTQAISQSEMDKAEKAFREAELALENARINYRSSVSSQAIDLGTQEQNLKATVLKISDLEKRLAKIQASMLSPMDGYVTAVGLEKGAYTGAMQQAFKIVNMDKLRVRADVKEYDIRKVSEGQEVVITGDAVNKEDGVTGKVLSVSSIAKKEKTTSGDEILIEVTVSIDAGHSILKPGLSVTCDIVTKVSNDVLIGSYEMLREDKDGNKTVFVYDEKNGVIREKAIKLGAISDLNVEIKEGLNPEELVVLNPLPSFQDNTKARIAKD